MSRAPDVTTARPRDQDLVDRMLALLDLEPLAPRRWSWAGSPGEPRRIFGGQLFAQSLVAATGTVDPARAAHSVHGYFVRPALTTKPIVFEVAELADSGSASYRQVLALQDGEPVASCSAAFQSEAAFIDRQPAMPPTPAPEDVGDDFEQATRPGVSEAARRAFTRGSPFQFRSIDAAPLLADGEAPARQRFWFRAARPLGDLPAGARRALLAYASDLRLLGSGLPPHGRRWFDGETLVASIDHAVWMHREAAMDDWLLYDQESPWTGAGRILARGHIYDRAGRLVATTCQEGVVRAVRRNGASASRGAAATPGRAGA